MFRRLMLPGSITVGVILMLSSPEPSWVRYITSGLWGAGFLLFSWWLADVTRSGNITKKSYDIARHFWVLCGLFCYASFYAVRHDFPVPPYAWITVMILVSLVVRLAVTLPDDYEKVTTPLR